jgi:tight adherence protein C
MNVERALREVVHGTPGPLGHAIEEGLRCLDAGMPRARAYERIASSARSEEVATLTTALARAERFGGSITDTLTAYARDLRSRVRAAAETDARTAPVKLVFPLALCFLPAFVLLTIVPIALSALRALGTV